MAHESEEQSLANDTPNSAQREEEYMRVSRECVNVTRRFSLADNGGEYQEGCFEDRRVCPDSDPCCASTFLINTHTEGARKRERESQVLGRFLDFIWEKTSSKVSKEKN